MSVAVASLRSRILSKLRALDGRKAIGRVYIDQEMRDAYLDIQARLPAVEVYTASAGTITAGAESFTLPTASSAEYAGNFRIRLQSMPRDLEKVTADEMAAFRNGRSTTTGFSRSRWFQPVETTDQSVVVWVHPINAAAEPYDLWRSIVTADFSATDISATTLNLSRTGQMALILKTAANILGAMDAEDVKTRRLNQGIAEKWDRQAEILVYTEASRRHDIESVGRIQRFVS